MVFFDTFQSCFNSGSFKGVSNFDFFLCQFSKNIFKYIFKIFYGVFDTFQSCFNPASFKDGSNFDLFNLKQKRLGW